MQKYGHLANAEPFERRACLVCDHPDPTFSWTDYSGEGTCNRCGTAYQLKWGALKEGETYPRINVRADAIPMLRRYFAETKDLNGQGTFMIPRDYPEQMEGARRFSEWWAANKHDYPELALAAERAAEVPSPSPTPQGPEAVSEPHAKPE